MAKFNLDNIKAPKDFPSIVLLYGADTFTMEETLDKIIKFLITNENDKIDFNILDGEDTDYHALVDIASQLPMMTDKRIVVVRRFDKMFSEKSRKKTTTYNSFAKYLETENTSTSLILTVDASETKLDLKKFPYDIISAKYHSLEFPVVYENQLSNWVVRRFAASGKAITPETADLIVAQTSPDLRSLANEVEKISLYQPEVKNITYDYVLNIIGSTRQNTAFELVNAVSKRDTNRAIHIMINILSISSEEILIIILLRDLFIKLWKLIELNNEGLPREEMAKQIGLRNAFFLNDYMTGIRKYSPEDINRAFLILCESDQKLKSSTGNSKLIIEEMLIKIMDGTN